MSCLRTSSSRVKKEPTGRSSIEEALEVWLRPQTVTEPVGPPLAVASGVPLSSSRNAQWSPLMSFCAWYAAARVYGGRCLVLQGDKGMASQRPRTRTDDSDRLNQTRTGNNSTTHELEWINHNRAAIVYTRKTAGPQQDCNLHAAQFIPAEE
jgi:hypothetical protein